MGKTSLITRQVKDVFSNVATSTLGACHHTLTVQVHNTNFRLQVWDTAGQERFRSIVPLYYRDSDAALLIYDITNPESYDSIKLWVNELKGHVLKPLILMVVGSKLDLNANRLVSIVYLGIVILIMLTFTPLK